MRCGPSWKISPTLATAVAGSGSSGPCSSPSAASPKNDVIDFGRREPSDLYRSVQQDQFFKLNLQRIEIRHCPFSASAICGKPQHALFVRFQVVEAYARVLIETQLLGRLVALASPVQ